MLKAKLCVTMFLSCSPSLWFPYWVREDHAAAPALLSPPAPLTQEGPNPSVPTCPCEAWGSTPAGRAAADTEREKEQHGHVTACPGAPSALWPCFNLCFKVYLLFRRKQPVGSVSYDKRVNDGLSNSGQPEPQHVTGSARKTQGAEGIPQYGHHKFVGINSSKAPRASGGRLCRS